MKYAQWMDMNALRWEPLTEEFIENWKKMNLEIVSLGGMQRSFEVVEKP